MNKDTIAGKIKEVGGEVRAKVDHAVGDHKGEAQGRRDEIAGNLQKNYGKAKDAVNDAVKKVNNA